MGVTTPTHMTLEINTTVGLSRFSSRRLIIAGKTRTCFFRVPLIMCVGVSLPMCGGGGGDEPRATGLENKIPE